MSLAISSWNMQGAGYDKLNAMCNVYADFKDTNIFLLQETGNPKSNNGIQPGEKYTIFNKNFLCEAACEDETAQHKRCTTAILLDDEIRGKFRGCYTIGRPDLRKAVVACFDDCAIATIHAPAVSGGNLEYLKQICTKLNNGELPWILMGDMNVDLSQSFPFELCDGSKIARPDQYNEIWIEHTARRDVRCLVLFPRENTQGTNGERTRKLDFAFLSSDFNQTYCHGVFNKKVLKSVTERVCLSDHNMIGIAFV